MILQTEIRNKQMNANFKTIFYLLLTQKSLEPAKDITFAQICNELVPDGFESPTIRIIRRPTRRLTYRPVI